MEVTARFTTSSGFLAQPRGVRRAIVRKHCSQLVVCTVSSAEDASNAARQARFLQEIDKLAEARRLESSRRRSSPIPQQRPDNALVARGPSDDGSLVRSTSKGTAEIDAAQARQAERRFVRVKFVLHLHLEYGQRLKVVGSDLMLGNWVLQHAPELQWSDGDRWHVSVDLPANGVYEYKYVILSSEGQHAISWQRGNNCVLAIKPDDDRVEVYDNWDGQPGSAVIANGQSSTRETRLQGWANQMDALAGSQRAELRRTRMELAAAQEDARGARADVSRMKATLARTQTEMLTAERRMRELERTNQLLKAQLAQSSLSFHKAFETAQRLLSKEQQPWLMSMDEEELVGELNATVAAASAPSTYPSDIVPPAPTTVDKAGSASDVDVMESLEFLNMLDNSQFGLRSKAAARMAVAISEGITGEALGSLDAMRGGYADEDEDDGVQEDVEEGAVEEQMDGVTSHALGDVVGEYEDKEDEEGWSEDDEVVAVLDDAEEEEEEGEEEDGEQEEEKNKEEGATAAVQQEEQVGSNDAAATTRHHHDGATDKGRASVSAVQDFIARIRQGLGVNGSAGDEEEEEEASSSSPRVPSVQPTNGTIATAAEEVVDDNNQQDEDETQPQVVDNSNVATVADDDHQPVVAAVQDDPSSEECSEESVDVAVTEAAPEEAETLVAATSGGVKNGATPAGATAMASNGSHGMPTVSRANGVEPQSVSP